MLFFSRISKNIYYCDNDFCEDYATIQAMRNPYHFNKFITFVFGTNKKGTELTIEKFLLPALKQKNEKHILNHTNKNYIAKVLKIYKNECFTSNDD